jgi:hypothetical protein
MGARGTKLRAGCLEERVGRKRALAAKGPRESKFRRQEEEK